MIGRLQTISVCGGYLNAAALEVATDFDTLYEASLEMLRVLCRLERLVYDRARAIDLSKGSWSCAVTGITAEKLQIALDNFQNAMVCQRRCPCVLRSGVLTVRPGNSRDQEG